MSTVYLVVPDGIDDPTRPSGGNVYDRRVARGLTELGWRVHECVVAGDWPHPDATARAQLGTIVAAIPDAAVVLIDGLIASTVPDVLVPESGRVRLVVLMHMPLGDGLADDGPRRLEAAEAGERERAVISAAVAVVTTSRWTKQWLGDRYAVDPDRIHVARPGVDAVALAGGTPAGGSLLVVAAVTPHKGHDVLLAALSTLTDLSWQCLCVGSLDRDPGFVQKACAQARDLGLRDRVRFSGPLAGAELDTAYSGADVLVVASRAETYGMVVVEALARGLPVVATAVGGVPEALGGGAEEDRPGLLVPPEDPVALSAALRRWVGEPRTRESLRRAAARRRGALSGWTETSARVGRVLAGVATA